MADTFTFEIKGLDELQRKLEELPKAVAKKVLRDDLKSAGEYLKQEMTANSPYRTGFLAEHIDSRVRLNSGEVSGTAFVGPEGHMYYPHEGVTGYGRQFDKALRSAIGKHATAGGLVPAVSVARFFEFGTRKMGAKPFMTSAFESSKDALLIKIIEGIRSALARFTK